MELKSEVAGDFYNAVSEEIEVLEKTEHSKIRAQTDHQEKFTFRKKLPHPQTAVIIDYRRSRDQDAEPRMYIPIEQIAASKQKNILPRTVSNKPICSKNDSKKNKICKTGEYHVLASVFDCRKQLIDSDDFFYVRQFFFE